MGIITLIGTSSTSLVACNIPQYTEKELADLKEKNNIKTKDGILEWMTLQEKPFNKVDNKYYYVVWRGNENNDWLIIKFKYDKYEKNKVLDKYNNYELQLFQTGTAGQGYWKDVCLVDDNNGISKYFAWSFYPNYFKSVYRWNNDNEPNTPFISPVSGEISDWNLKRQNNINNNDDEIKVTIKNKGISENPIYQLEANYFNWLSITNELETNNIPPYSGRN